MTNYAAFAEYYDVDHAMTLDVGFYLDFAQRCGSPILELGCGTGRVLIPLAAAGFEVYGVDNAAPMLAICRQKVEAHQLEARVHVTQADMVQFALPRTDVALAYAALRSFMHVLTQTDQVACFQQVYRHLRPGGYFIIDIIAPDMEKLVQQPSETWAVRQKFSLPNGHHVVRKDRLVQHDRVNQVRHFAFRFEEVDAMGAVVRESLVPLATRYTFRYELQLLLEQVGFEVVALFRDYEQQPYDGTGELIAVARRPD